MAAAELAGDLVAHAPSHCDDVSLVLPIVVEVVVAAARELRRRHLVRRELGAHAPPDVVGIERRAVFEDDHRGDLFAAFGMRHPEHERVADLRERLEHGLDLERRDVRAARLDHLGETAGEEHAAVFEVGAVAGVVPAVRVEGLFALTLVEAGHEPVPAHAELAFLAVGKYLAGVGVDDLVVEVVRPVVRAQGLGHAHVRRVALRRHAQPVPDRRRGERDAA